MSPSRLPPCLPSWPPTSLPTFLAACPPSRDWSHVDADPIIQLVKARLNASLAATAPSLLELVDRVRKQVMGSNGTSGSDSAIGAKDVEVLQLLGEGSVSTSGGGGAQTHSTWPYGN